MFEIGNSLREARLRQHLDFPAVEQGTKIRAKYLRALEDERFELLPAHAYNDKRECLFEPPGQDHPIKYKHNGQLMRRVAAAQR